MTSNLKLLHWFIRKKVKKKRVLNAQIIQKKIQITTHSVNPGKLIRLSTHHIKLFLFFILI